MMETKRSEKRRGVGVQLSVLRSGFLDTSAGLALKSGAPLKIAQRQDAQSQANRAEKQERVALATEKAAHVYERVKAPNA